MNGLVVDLLELSKLENITETFNPVNYNIGEQIAVVISHFSLLISDKNISQSIWSTYISKCQKPGKFFAAKQMLKQGE